MYVVSRIISERWGFNKWKRLFQSHLTMEKFTNKWINYKLHRRFNNWRDNVKTKGAGE